MNKSLISDCMKLLIITLVAGLALGFCLQSYKRSDCSSE